MTKFLCKCSAIIRMDDWEVSHKFISEKNYDKYYGKIDSEELFFEMTNFFKCPKCGRLWFYWDACPSGAPIEYLPIKEDYKATKIETTLNDISQIVKFFRPSLRIEKLFNLSITIDGKISVLKDTLIIKLTKNYYLQLSTSHKGISLFLIKKENFVVDGEYTKKELKTIVLKEVENISIENFDILEISEVLVENNSVMGYILEGYNKELCIWASFDKIWIAESSKTLEMLQELLNCYGSVNLIKERVS